jgi:4-hydroxy-3-methylbut-2-enyl diphosphate reductase
LREIVKAKVIDSGLVHKKKVDRKDDFIDNNFLLKTKKIGIVSQTTQSKDKYLQVVVDLIKRYSYLCRDDIGIKEFYLFNTICPDCLKRQERLKRVAKKVDLMIIIGDRDSANTRRLYRIAKKIRKNSYHVESQEDLNRLPILENFSIGIASGASTPQILIREIIRSLKERWKKREI